MKQFTLLWNVPQRNVYKYTVYVYIYIYIKKNIYIYIYIFVYLFPPEWRCGADQLPGPAPLPGGHPPGQHAEALPRERRPHPPHRAGAHPGQVRPCAQGFTSGSYLWQAAPRPHHHHHQEETALQSSGLQPWSPGPTVLNALEDVSLLQHTWSKWIGCCQAWLTTFYLNQVCR